MLIHASARSGAATALSGDAHIVIAIDVQSSGVRMQSFFRGERDASYVALIDERLPVDMAALLAELRAQIEKPQGSDHA